MEPEKLVSWRRSLMKQEEGLKEEEIQILEVNRASIECAQLLLESQRVLDSVKVILLLLVNTKRRAELENSQSQTNEEPIEEIYQFRRELWLKFPISGKFRIIRLKTLLRFYPTPLSLSLSRSFSLSTSSSSMMNPLTRSNTSLSTTTTRSPIEIRVKPLSLGERNDIDITLESLLTYVAILFEYQILENDLREYGEKKREKLWYCINQQQQQSNGYLFIASYIHHKRGNIRDDPMIKWWMAMEVRHFQRAILSESYREEFTHSSLIAHAREILMIEALSTNWQHHQWIHYRIGEHRSDFWITGMENEYHVSALWLIETDLFSLSFTRRREYPGQIIIGERDFFERFLPSLYRKILSDIISFLQYQVLTRPSDYEDYFGDWTSRKSGLILSLSQIFTDQFPEKPPENSYQMFLFNIEVVKSYSLPVTRLIGSSSQAESLQYRLKRRLKRVENGNENGGGYQLFQTPPAQLIDIEDLFKKPDQLLPPCLSQLVEHTKKSWCINYDRFYLTRVLLDMGYGGEPEKILTLMSLNQNSREKRESLRNLLLNETRKKALSPWSDLPFCGTIINTIHSSGELIRCPFEAKVNKAKRIVSSDTEKELYRSQCACSIGAPSMRHPVDYIKHQITPLTGGGKIKKEKV